MWLFMDIIQCCRISDNASCCGHGEAWAQIIDRCSCEMVKINVTYTHADVTKTMQPKHIYRVWYSLNLHMCSSKMVVKTGPGKTAPARPVGMAIHLATCTCKLLDLGKLIWARIPKFSTKYQAWHPWWTYEWIVQYTSRISHKVSYRWPENFRVSY